MPALSPDAWLVVTVTGVWLIAAEFCLPGRVVFAAAGAVFVLGGAWQLFHAEQLPNLVLALVLIMGTAIALAIPLRIARAGRRKKIQLGD